MRCLFVISRFMWCNQFIDEHRVHKSLTSFLSLAPVWNVSSHTDFFWFSYYCCNSLHYSTGSDSQALSIWLIWLWVYMPRVFEMLVCFTSFRFDVSSCGALGSFLFHEAHIFMIIMFKRKTTKSRDSGHWARNMGWQKKPCHKEM